MNKWKLLRIVIIIIAVISSFFTPLEPQAIPPIDWTALLIIFIFIPISLLFIISIQTGSSRSGVKWSKPDWNINPLNFKDPVHFFHLGAYAMLCQGFVSLIRVYFSQVTFYPEILIPLVMGFGLLIGVKLIMIVYRAKYIENT